jgi:hypothetical protein
MQMRCACTEVTLGLKEATRRGENDRRHAQSAIDATVVSDTVQGVDARLITQSYLIVAPQRDERG